MWQLDSQESKECQRFILINNQGVVTFGEALALFRNSEDFRGFFIEFLQQLPFNAYKWETPPFSTSLLKRKFEFVTLNAPSLDRPADSSAFDQYTGTTGDNVVAFPNLGKDAYLVVPSCTDTRTNYCHLGSFSKSAPYDQQQRLWAFVGEIGLRLISDTPLWLSTAGGGVPWLHVRFDRFPKYYGYAEFRQSTWPG